MATEMEAHSACADVEALLKSNALVRGVQVERDHDAERSWMLVIETVMEIPEHIRRKMPNDWYGTKIRYEVSHLGRQQAAE